MKKLLITGATGAAMMLAACNTKTTDSPVVNTDTVVATNAVAITNIDSLLNQKKVDYNMDLSNVSYADLHLLLNYTYAQHGFWFKEPELNKRFMQYKWYEDLIHNAYFTKMKSENSEGKDQVYWILQEEYAKSEFWEEWNSKKYEQLKNKITLTAEEKAFADRVKARMAEMDKDKYRNEEGLKLYNTNLLLNTVENPELLAQLTKNGFALQPSKYEQLFHIYEQNDYEMTPSYISTDLMLQLFSQYNRYVLEGLEQDCMAPNISKMSEGLYKKAMELAATETNEQLKSYAEFCATYYAVALSLLNEKAYEVPANLAEAYKAEITLIKKEEDSESPLLQTTTAFGYSLFKPRAQYTRTEAAKRYFRTMMWLQTAYFCPSNDGLQKALYMAKLYKDSDASIKKAARAAFDPLDYLMGEPNNIPVLELAEHLQEMGISQTSDVLDENVMKKATALIEKLNASKSSIKPKIQVSCQPKINLMPQRYTPDGDVLNEICDLEPNSERAYPRGVDVFDAFGVKAAKALNDTFYADNKNWADYEKHRKKVSDKFGKFGSWDKTASNKWLQMLVNLQQEDKNAPDYMRSNGWQLKNLNAALASWAELKHNTILYALQPSGAECGGGEEDELPQPQQVGYVEPNLKFWKTLKQAVEQTYAMAKKAGYDVDDNKGGDRNLKGQTEALISTIEFLIETSEKELNGKQLTAEDFETIRTLGSNVEYMTLGFLCQRDQYSTWETVKDVDRNMAVVADVYTRSIIGCDKSGILHCGVGRANTIYVVAEINGKYYLTKGAALSYHEFVRPVGTRLTDEEWQEMLDKGEAPQTPAWLKPFTISNPNVKSQQGSDYLYSSGC